MCSVTGRTYLGTHVSRVRSTRIFARENRYLTRIGKPNVAELPFTGVGGSVCEFLVTVVVIQFEPIGTIRTPFVRKYDAPHQPGGDGEQAEGVITLLPNQNFEQALEDLEGIEKIWLIYHFDRNENWKPKVQVPRGERKKRGLFATRSPHRPNAIGLSLVDLVNVNGLELCVRNVDLLDGTPILDIKPYLPYLEAHPDAKAGWIDIANAAFKDPPFTVTYSNLASEQLDFLLQHGVRIQPLIEKHLSRDPSPHPYKRIESTQQGLAIAIRAWRADFAVQENTVTVLRIRSGYESAHVQTTNADAMSDGVVQKAFVTKWP